MRQTFIIVFCLTYALCSFVFFGTITRKISFGMGFGGVFYFIFSGIFFLFLTSQFLYFIFKKNGLKTSEFYSVAIFIDLFILLCCIYFITIGRGNEDAFFVK